MPKQIFYDTSGKPIYDKENFTPEEFLKASQAELTKRTPVAPPPKDTSIIGVPETSKGITSIMARASGNALPAIGGMLGELVAPETFGASAAGGAMIGSYAQNKLKEIAPYYFGQPSNNVARSVALDGILQGILGGAGRGLLYAGAKLPLIGRSAAGLAAAIPQVPDTVINLVRALQTLGTVPPVPPTGAVSQ